MIWEGEILQCEIIQKNYSAFTFIHRKTTPIKEEDIDLIYSTNFDYRFNWRRKITKPIDDIDRKLYKFFFAAMVKGRNGIERIECFQYYLLKNQDRSERLYIKE